MLPLRSIKARRADFSSEVKFRNRWSNSFCGSVNGFSSTPLEFQLIRIPLSRAAWIEAKRTRPDVRRAMTWSTETFFSGYAWLFSGKMPFRNEISRPWPLTIP